MPVAQGASGLIAAGTILLIDDSAPVREVLRIALESEGYSVIEAADGREGPCGMRRTCESCR